MSIHRHNISFENAQKKRNYYENAPQIRDVIKSTREQQIKQHHQVSSSH